MTRPNQEDITSKLELMKTRMERFLQTGMVDAYDYVARNYNHHLEELWFSGERGDVLRGYMDAKKGMDKERRQWSRK